MTEAMPDNLGNYLDFRNGKTSPDRNGGASFPVYGSNGIIGHSEETNAPARTIVIGRVGTYCGSVHFSKSPCWVTDNAIICTAPKGEERYWFYNLLLADLNNYRAGSGQPLLNQGILKQIKQIVPSVIERISIGETLEALDEKVEVNHQIITTLEGVARLLFKDWFVDFGPTRAKIEGRKPYLASDIWDLFPDRFGDNGVPIGWALKTLGDFDLELESGRRPKGGIDKTLASGVPSVGAESIYGVGRFDYSKVKFVSEEFAHSTSLGWVQAYDVAIYKDGANVGDPSRVALFGCGFPFDKFMVNEHVFLLRSEQLGQIFLYFLMQSHQVSDRLDKLGKGKAAQPGLNQGEVKSCSFVWPGSKLCTAFSNLVLPWMELALHHGKESQDLAQSFRLLLPKLMSGEVRLRNSEKFAGEVL